MNINLGALTPSPSTGSTSKRTWIIVTIVTIIILLIVGSIGAYVVTKRQKGEPVQIPLISASQTKVQLNEEYKNPLDKESQYVNPFDEFKSPFHSLQ